METAAFNLPNNTMKKKAPKGTYEIRVTAKANGTYNAATKTIKVVVK